MSDSQHPQTNAPSTPIPPGDENGGGPSPAARPDSPDFSHSMETVTVDPQELAMLRAAGRAPAPGQRSGGPQADPHTGQQQPGPAGPAAPGAPAGSGAAAPTDSFGYAADRASAATTFLSEDQRRSAMTGPDRSGNPTAPGGATAPNAQAPGGAPAPGTPAAAGAAPYGSGSAPAHGQPSASAPGAAWGDSPRVPEAAAETVSVPMTPRGSQLFGGPVSAPQPSAPTSAPSAPQTSSAPRVPSVGGPAPVASAGAPTQQTPFPSDSAAVGATPGTSPYYTASSSAPPAPTARFGGSDYYSGAAVQVPSEPGTGTPSAQSAGPAAQTMPVYGPRAGAEAINPADSVGSWMLALFLFNIPVVGFIYLLVVAFGGSASVSRRNCARAIFAWQLILLVVGLIFLSVGGLALLGLPSSSSS